MPDTDTAPPKNKGGRPRKDVDLNMVQKLAEIGCTHEEIAYALSVSVDTLTRRDGFAEAYKKGDLAGKQSIRHGQYQAMKRGNTVMLVWLGKTRLGQREVVSNEHSGGITFSDGVKEKLLDRLTTRLAIARTDEPDPVIN